ncbi:MAG: glycosyltransferase [Acidimicrobiia bacterium]
MSDERGLFEHADGIVPRLEHGYCTDDNARLLVLTSREPDAGVPARLSRLALEFVLDAQTMGGRFRNRMDQTGHWIDEAATGDCWGRGVWGLGVAASSHDDADVRREAQIGFDTASQTRSRWARSMAFAAMGAVEVLRVRPDHRRARALVIDALALIGTSTDGSWRWPQPRLTYANAALAEIKIAGGHALDRDQDVEHGLTMLSWLLDMEMASGHLSVVGVGGRGPGERGPQFDQQPIEAAAMADACRRAEQVTGDSRWTGGVLAAAGWFHGRNDTGAVMFDPVSGGGYDGLQPDGVNLNQGAESTMAFVSTMQLAGAVSVTR